MQASHRVPKFTRRDFQYLADVLRTIDFDCCADRKRCITEFTSALHATNSNFKPERFRAACTPDGGRKVVRHA
jgi:hypothetical protein